MKLALHRSGVGRGTRVAGLVLAGGLGTRLGGRDKGLVRYRGKPMAQRAAERLAPRCELVAISANRRLPRYLPWADLVLADRHPDHPGPLAGISACLSAVRTRWLLTIPCDAVHLPPGLHERLLRALRLNGGAQAAVVHDGERLQPLLAALRGDLGESVDRYLAGGGRAVHRWLATLEVVEVPSGGGVSNFNTWPPEGARSR